MWRYQVYVLAVFGALHVTYNNEVRHEKSKLKRFTPHYVLTVFLTSYIFSGSTIFVFLSSASSNIHRREYTTCWLTSRCLSPLPLVCWCWKSLWFSLVLNIFWWARLNSSMRILWIAGGADDIFAFLLAAEVVVVVDGDSFFISKLPALPFVSHERVNFFSARFLNSSLIASLRLACCCSDVDGFGALPNCCCCSAVLAIEADSIFVTECRFCSIIITLLSLFFIKWFVTAGFSCACDDDDSCVLELLISSYTVLLIVFRLGTNVLLIIVGPSSDNFMTVVFEFFLPFAALLSDDCSEGIFGISAGTARSCRHSAPLPLPLLL